jgi:hypothetical protein
MINNSNFYFGSQHFGPPNFGWFSAFKWKFKMLVNQQIPSGISYSITCWKDINLQYKILARRTQISYFFRVEFKLKIAFWNSIFFAPNLVDISQNILIILFDRKLVLRNSQKIYSLSVLLLVLFSILEIKGALNLRPVVYVWFWFIT